MNINQILSNPADMQLITTSRKREIVIAVPHHAPGGTTRLPCPEHPVSDENAGYLGHYIAEKLNASSVIACNYIFDPNKDLSSDYSRRIIEWSPQLLVEIHGHGGGKANYEIEVSAGHAAGNRWSIPFAESVAAGLNGLTELSPVTISGNFEDIFFQATRSRTISTDRWLALHIELPGKLRIHPGTNPSQPPDIAWPFCDILVESIRRIYKDMIN